MVLQSTVGTFRQTEHQKVAMAWAVNQEAPKELHWVGSIRSAKTAGAAFIDFMLACAGVGPQLHGAVSVGAYRRNIWPYLRDYGLIFGVPVVERLRHREPHILIGGVECFVFGMKLAGASDSMQGFTSYHTHIDEAPLMHPDAYDEAMDRSSGRGCKVLTTMNPESEGHWFKTGVIDACDGDLSTMMVSRLENNPFVDDATKEWLSGRYTGHLWRRKINAEWVGAAGLVYPTWENVRADFPDRPYIDMSVDWGVTAATCGLYFARRRDAAGWIVCGEYYETGERVERSTGDHANGLLAAGRKIGVLDDIVQDPSAAALRIELEQRGHRTISADNDRKEGLEATRLALENGDLVIDARACPNLVREIRGYSWDVRATERGDDEPDGSTDDHAMDALRYWVMHRRPSLPTLSYIGNASLR